MSKGLTRFQYDILGVLHANGPTYGLGVGEAIEERTGYEVSHPRLYTNLDELVEAGLVDKSEVDGRTNEYVVTRAGREALAARVAELGGDWE